MYRVNGTSRKRLREMAKDIRTRMGVREDGIIPILSMLEKEINEMGWDLEIVDPKEIPGTYAITTPQLKTVKISEPTYMKAYTGRERERFTVAHELGHLVLHQNVALSFARSEDTVKAFEDPEWQANTFAAELLVPIDKITDMSIEEISKKYGVSYQVAKIQKSYADV